MNSKKPSFPQTTAIPHLSQPLMEPHSSLRLLLLFLCLAISIGGARSRLGPDVSPTPEPAASRLVPHVSPTPEPAASRLVPDVSPIPEPAASPSSFPSEDIPFEAIGLFALSDSPAESVVVNEAAALVAELDGTSANEPSPAQSVSVNEAAMLVAALDVLSANEPPPAESVSVNEAAMLVAALGVPSAEELVEGVDIAAALDSLDENNTSNTLPITSS